MSKKLKKIAQNWNTSKILIYTSFYTILTQFELFCFLKIQIVLNLYGSDTRRCRFSIRLRFWILDAGDVRLLCALRAATNRDGAHATCLLFYPSPARSLTPVNGIVQILLTFRKIIITQLLQPISMLLNQNQNYCNFQKHSKPKKKVWFLDWTIYHSW